MNNNYTPFHTLPLLENMKNIYWKNGHKRISKDVIQSTDQYPTYFLNMRGINANLLYFVYITSV